MGARTPSMALCLVLAGCVVDLGIESKDGQADGVTDPVDEDPPDDVVDVPDAPDTLDDPDVIDDPDVVDAPDLPGELDVEPDVETDVDPDMPCGGIAVWGVCWYLGESGRTCNTTCSPRGGHSDRARLHVGTPAQGGSREDCEELLTLLGHPGAVTPGSAVNAKGLGCHKWTDGTLFWVDDVDLDPDSSHPPAELVCGCIE